MTNDINTLNGSLSELGETMADNLVSMGVVDASASDGLTTLAGRILDIEPSIGGLDLDTAVTISSSESSISLGSSIVLTSKLTASYDDETIVDVDLSGVLQNATLLFKNGNTTIGTAVTDVNGVATFTYTPPAIGTLSLKAIFAGTDNFNNCESSFINVTVVAPSYDDIVLTADDSILSYYDGDSTTLRAQLMDGSSTASVSGVTVEFFNGSTSLGTAQTDSTGMATKTYTSTGAGDVSLKAEADNGTLSSESFVVEDCVKYIQITYSTDGSHSINATLPSTFKVEYEEYITQTSGNSAYMGIGESTSRVILFGKVLSADSIHSARVRTSSSGSGDVNYTGSTITLDGWHSVFASFNGTTFNFNNEISITDFKGVSLSKITHVGISKYSGSSGQIRNIKIKPL